MKAISPVRSYRISGGASPEHALMGISRSGGKSPAADDPLSLLYNMNDCYTKLKELVPSIPQNRSVSKMDILQHVIDYILDLQIALDSNVAITTTATTTTTASLQHHQHQHQQQQQQHHQHQQQQQQQQHHHHPRPGHGAAAPGAPSRTPLTALNTDISILSLQSPELPSELLLPDDSRTQQHHR